MIDDAVRRTVRQRAHFACEYCGLREADVSGELTIDHFQPTSKGGSDALENLIYCCIWATNVNRPIGRRRQAPRTFGTHDKVQQPSIFYCLKLVNYNPSRMLAPLHCVVCNSTAQHSLLIACDNTN